MSNGNSPAFPCQDNKKQIYTGMNLRDYFALEALNGLIKKGFLDYIEVPNYDSDPDEDDSDLDAPVLPDAKAIAKDAYLIADAMLDERVKYK